MKNSLWTSFYIVVNLVLGLFLTIIFARFTSKVIFGEYNFIISLLAFFSIFSLPGLNTSIFRAIARGKDGYYKESVRHSFIFSLIAVPIIIIIGIYYFYMSSFTLAWILFIIAIFFPFFYAPNNWISLFQGKKRFDLFSKYSTILVLIRTLTVIMAILYTNQLFFIILAYFFSTVFCNIIFYIKSINFLENDLKEEGWKKSGYKLSLAEFVNICYDNVDKILIGIFLGPILLAEYVIAVSIIIQIRGILNQILRIFYPNIFELDPSGTKQIFIKIIPTVIIVGIFSVGILILVMPWLINTLYSNVYASSIFYAQLYTLTLPLALIMSLTNVILISFGHENMLLKFRFFGLILVIILYLVFIPLFGLFGAILSSIIYYIFLNFLQYFYIIEK